jgi:hypothetical protein
LFGADVNHFGGNYGTSLQAACTGGDQSAEEPELENYKGLIKSFLVAGADVNHQGGKYESALRAALAWNSVDIADHLFETDETCIFTWFDKGGITKR